ncbi:MAG TPA: pyridoxamine 5'-phosphate oxidase family protein [Candidatus Saccharimonadales bacterium]|nr:pyridoxamine 5'-phosphate oxidase family protein [Candidatus Saccharimonadales bacterium]
MNLLSMHAKQTDRANIANKYRDVHVFLKEHPVGVLATVDPNSNPHAATIYFAVDSSFTITFLTKRGTKKSDNMRTHNQAMLVVFDAPQQATTQIAGLVTEITDQDEVHQVFRSTLRASLHEGRSAVPPITKIAAGAFVAYRLTPTQVRHSCYGPAPVGKRQKMFEVIDLPL